MKEIETLVEEKTKDSTDITKMIKDGELQAAASAKVYTLLYLTNSQVLSFVM